MPSGIRKILVVDDMLLNREILKDIFSNEYIIGEAANGVEAMDYLGKNPDTSAVLLDITMPEMNGYEVIHEMKGSGRLNDIPIIVTAAQGDSEAEALALKLGAHDIIFKPFDTDIVRQRVKRIMLNREKERFRLENAVLRSESYGATHDALTGIYNRLAFCRRARELLDENPNQAYTLVRLNINKFKTINSLFGAGIGDEILCRIADLLTDKIGDNGVYGRLEADHFAFIAKTESLRGINSEKALERCAMLLSVHCPVSISAGVYEISDPSVSVPVMCDCANIALQTLKNDYRRNCAVYDDALHRKTLNEQSISSEMESAVRKGEFVIYLQPIYALSNPDIPLRAEALVRWKHPKKGIISPSDFIPVFERNGFISVLDRYVWETTCKYLRKRLDEKQPVVPICINVSRRSLYAQSVSEDISSLVKKYDIDPGYIKIEITESAYTDNPAQLLKTVEELQAKGFLICMDDFGSGYSSLNTLKDIPVDVLKIDMMFLRDFEKSERVGNILTSIVRMAKWLNIPTIAEGVETKAQADFLRSIGCDCVQGFYFSKPLPTEEFEKLLSALPDSKDFKPEVFIDKSELDILFSGNKIVSRLMNGLPGGLGFYEYVDNRLEAIRVNDGYYELLGYDARSFMEDAKNPMAQVLAEDAELLREKCREILLSHGTARLVLRRYSSEGKLLHLDCSLRYLGGAVSSRPLLFICFLDITELVLMRRQLKAEKEKIAVLTEAVPCPIFTFTRDTEPRMTGCNAAGALLLGIEPDDRFTLFGSPASEIFPSLEWVEAALSRDNTCAAEGDLTLRTGIKTAHGEKQVCLRVNPVDSDEGKLLRLILSEL